MDRRTIFGLFMIALIIILYPFYMQAVAPPADPSVKTTSAVDSASTPTHPDTLLKSKTNISKESVLPKAVSLTKDTIKQSEKIIRINSEIYSAEISNLGGGSIKSWKILPYKTHDGQPVDFIESSKNLNLNFVFQGKNYNTWNIPYSIINTDSVIDLITKQKNTLMFVYHFDSERQIIQNLTFYNDRYDVDIEVQFKNFGDDITNGEYQIQWLSALKSTELDRNGDLSHTISYAYMGDEKEEFDIGTDPSKETSWSGVTKWVASRTKYFAVYIIPQEKDGIGCKLTSTTTHENGLLTKKSNFMNIQMKFEPNVVDRYKFYIGPMDYHILKEYDDNVAVTMEWGWAVFRPLTKAIFYTFNFLYDIIPNYGWVIIVFTLLVRIILYPLTYKTFVGMQKMKVVMPRQKEIQKKYKDNPSRMQQEMMKLYKEAGYNPLSGCLPMLIQMPLLFPIYQVFNQSIELRLAPFFGWITDLSRPDTITILHTGLPFIGDFHVNPLPIIMTVLTFLQQKIAPMTPMGDDSDPAQRFNQKFLMYGMPIMFFFLFNGFASGLVLYWTVFNVLTMAQQVMMQKFVEVK